MIIKKVPESTPSDPDFRVYFMFDPDTKLSELGVAVEAFCFERSGADRFGFSDDQLREFGRTSLIINELGSFAANFDPDSAEEATIDSKPKPYECTSEQLALLGSMLWQYSEDTLWDEIKAAKASNVPRLATARRREEGDMAKDMLKVIQTEVEVVSLLPSKPRLPFGFNIAPTENVS